MDADGEQNLRIRDLEGRVNEVENSLSRIEAQLSTLTNIGKGLFTMIALVLGVDIAPLVGVA
jgi:hypothetical protein